MKTHLINLLSKVTLLSAMVLLTSVASAQGQSLAYRVKVNIPFDFTVGEKKLPAGEYSIGRASQRSEDIVISINNLEGRTKAIRLTNATLTTHAKKRSELVFHLYGDQHFLYQVWPAGATMGRQFPESRSERAQRQLANKTGVAENVKRKTVTIAGILQ
jgi:hypothetical protein